jgi:hypothetical protein
MMGTVCRAIHLILRPHLVLKTNQITKFICALKIIKAVMVHNLDEQAWLFWSHHNFLTKYLLNVGPGTFKNNVPVCFSKLPCLFLSAILSVPTATPYS